MSPTRQEILKQYNEDINTAAEYFAKGITPLSLHEKDNKESVWLSYLFDQLNALHLLDEAKKRAEEIKRNQPPHQENFLDLVPKKPAREPRKIPPLHPGDPEPFMQIVTDPGRRSRAIGSDVGHDRTKRNRVRRIELGLPEKRPSWRQLLLAWNALTEEDKEYLHDIGFRPKQVRNPHGETVERMLRALGKI